MKLPILLSLAFATLAAASYEKWTSSDGRTAELELVSVAKDGEEPVGTFRMRNGKKIEIKASGLDESSAARLGEWVDPNTPAAPESVFDDAFEGNLVRLDGDKLKGCDDATKPNKYYVFYYTASWCGPCQQFTPSLVEFYNKNKDGNDDFELVLITADREEKAMEGYAKAKAMPWPQLKFSKAKAFSSKHEYGVKGYPWLVVTDLDGEVVKSAVAFSVLPELKGILSK